MQQTSTPQNNLSAIIYMVLSAILAAFFASLFYNTYWKWLPIYVLSDLRPIWGIIYADPYGLLIIPALFFTNTMLYYFKLSRH